MFSFFCYAVTQSITLFLSSNGGYRYFRNGDSVMTKTSDKLIKLQIEKYLDAISKMNVPTEILLALLQYCIVCMGIRNV